MSNVSLFLLFSFSYCPSCVYKGSCMVARSLVSVSQISIYLVTVLNTYPFTLSPCHSVSSLSLSLLSIISLLSLTSLSLYHLSYPPPLPCQLGVALSLDRCCPDRRLKLPLQPYTLSLQSGSPCLCHTFLPHPCGSLRPFVN